VYDLLVTDFFVSRAGADASWAQWIAWQLEANGYTVAIQDWDFGPGVNFVHKMRQASTAERTIAVLSPRYFQSRFTEAEWTAAFYTDASGEEGRLLPIRIESFPLPGMFGPRAYLDLFDLDPDIARQRLLDWIGRAGKRRVKPDREPIFPGSAKPEPKFPGQPPPIFRLPARNRNFAGREALLEVLRNQLAGGRAAALTAATRQVATHGLGGTGKSQLAIAYAWRWASDYSRIIWLRAETPEALGADFDALANDLCLFNSNKPAEQAAVIEAVRKHLTENPGWLLIFDNAPEPRAVEHAVPRAGGQVIFTSRYTAWGKHAAPLRVDVWLPEEAEQFLLQRVGTKAHRAAAELAQELGYLPLALEHAAAYCEQASLALSDYLAVFRARRLALFSPEILSGDEACTVTTTWNLSLDRIRDDEKCPEAAALFTLCAFFGPDRIPLEMVWSGADYLPEPLAAALRDDLKVNGALSALLRYSLVVVEGSGKDRVVSVHRLLQEVTRERLTEGEKTRWATAALRIVHQAFPDNGEDVRTWPSCGQLAPHAVAVLDYVEPREIEQEVTARLLNQLARYAYGRAEYATAEPLLQRALAIREKALGLDHPDTAASLNDLAVLYRDQGRYKEAEPLYERALAIREKALGPDHSSTATSLNNLAMLYRNQGRYEEAEPLYQRALAIREALGPDHPHTASSLNNLAALYDDQGRYKEAEPLYRRALAIWEKALGPDHPDTATSLNNLALLYGNQGRYGEAEPLYQRALTIRERALGPDHPLTASSLNNLAALYDDQGCYEKAEPPYRRALAIKEKALGPDHPSTATSLNNLALLYGNQGRYKKAEPLYQRALAIREKALGPDHPDTAMTLNNLALLYNDQGRYEKAEPLYRRALAIREKALGPDHPSTANTRANYAALLRATGRDAEAVALEAQTKVRRGES
jgi:tetratricopeptide (TPR) repeat protein